MVDPSLVAWYADLRTHRQDLPEWPIVLFGANREVHAFWGMELLTAGKYQPPQHLTAAQS